MTLRFSLTTGWLASNSLSFAIRSFAGRGYEPRGFGKFKTANWPRYLPADIDGSGAMDLRDLCEFALHWGETGCGRCGGANMTCGGDVDWNDLRELCAWWLAGK